MADHLREGTKTHQQADEGNNSKTSALGGIQIHNSIWIKLKVNSNDEANDDLSSYVFLTLRAEGISITADPRPQHQPLWSYKRKARELDSTTCEECGKSFPSLKSKYGHMRYHPDRVHRRMMRRSFTQLAKRPATITKCQTPGLPYEVCIASEMLMQMSRDDSHL